MELRRLRRSNFVERCHRDSCDRHVFGRPTECLAVKVTLEIVEGPVAAQVGAGSHWSKNVAVEVLEVGGLELEIIVVVDVVVAIMMLRLGGGLGSVDVPSAMLGGGGLDEIGGPFGWTS